MTDHLHGILIIGEASTGPASQPDSEKSHTLGWMLGQFKGAASYYIHKHLPAFRWQHNFYEHIIRNDEDLDPIRRYIRENPSHHWHKSQQQSRHEYRIWETDMYFSQSRFPIDKNPCI